MGARSKLVVGNLKMHQTIGQSAELARELLRRLPNSKAGAVAICPSFTALPAVAEALRGSHIALGAQDCFWAAQGPFTGEVSPAQLKDVGCRFVILGHSERRRQLGETSEQVQRKLMAALAEGLTPIVCVGESNDEREAGETTEVINQQTERSLGGLTSEQAARLVVAYEPVWAIGSGRNATPAQAQEVHHRLRQLLGKLLGPELVEKMLILYGGSVRPDNVRDLMQQPDVDGALVGGASLVAEEFAAVVQGAGVV